MDSKEVKVIKDGDRYQVQVDGVKRSSYGTEERANKAAELTKQMLDYTDKHPR